MAKFVDRAALLLLLIEVAEERARHCYDGYQTREARETLEAVQDIRKELTSITRTEAAMADIMAEMSSETRVEKLNADVIDRVERYINQWHGGDCDFRSLVRIILKLVDEEQGLRGLSASEVACYKWPGDTSEHRTLRAAYVEGAARFHAAAEEASHG